MNVQEMFAEIPKLTSDERLELIEKLTQSLRSPHTGSTRKSLPASQVRGVLKTSQPLPSHEEIKQDYISYLEEKYS